MTEIDEFTMVEFNANDAAIPVEDDEIQIIMILILIIFENNMRELDVWIAFLSKDTSATS